MKLTIIRNDNFVSIDGRAISVDCSSLPADLHAVQWDGLTGHIERQGLMNQTIDSVSAFQSVIDLWTAAAYAIDNPPPPDPPTPEQIEKAYIAAVQSMMDAEAKAHGYDDVVSACSYAGYDNAFQAEGLSFGQWRAAIWVYGYAEMEKIKTGIRPLPTIEAFLAELPTRVLP